MKFYLVGGAVRDRLLGLPVKERDWVVVGATPQEMLSLGFKQVGKEFPVFLHPKTREEYALARLERKVKPGYTGFTFDTSAHVSLEDDLKRRDLTINAMAETPEGDLIDPYHGAKDIEDKMLRHVSDAFAEDPVRILRVGRFFARYAYLGFELANETLSLMREMVAKGEVNALVAERVWKELERSLTEKNPEVFFKVLDEANALRILFPELDLKGDGFKALQMAVKVSNEPTVRFAALFHDLNDPKKTMAALYRRYRIPSIFKEVATLTALHHKTALNFDALTAVEIQALFNATDAYRRTSRFDTFLLAVKAIAQTHALSFHEEKIKRLLAIGKAVNVQTFLDQGLHGLDLAKAIQNARIDAIGMMIKDKI